MVNDLGPAEYAARTIGPATVVPHVPLQRLQPQPNTWHLPLPPTIHEEE